MTLSDELVALFAKLESKQEKRALFDDDALEKIKGYGEFHQIAERLSQNIRDPDLMVLLALRCLANQKSGLAARMADVSLVATFPEQANADARHTVQVVREMIHNAREEILVAGFAITGGGGLLELLLESDKSVKRITIICSDWKSDSGTDAVALFTKGWPTYRTRPDIFQYNDPDGKTGMHMKCMIIDAREMLIGSANFTYSGMNKNFELGLRVGGEPAAKARNVFDSFLQSKLFRKVV
jgi:phosphatidylserine/phosphatidylglycerophosphate/cardiolipin synthase-like enzyme